MVQRVSLIATVLNESTSIDRLLRSLADQTRRPDEVVVVDGGSTDGTPEALARFAETAPFAVKVLVKPGANIAAGRNAAISAAAGPLIAVTDAGVRLEPDWLEHLSAPFESEPAPDVVSGFFESEPQSFFERVLGAITLPALSEVNGATFNPSSRSVAFRRDAWQRVGGYPEWLDYCEDLVFDFALRDAGFGFAFAPRALVHFQPRGNLRAFWKQYYRYARGDGKADLWRVRHLARYGTYLVGGPVAVALAARHPLGWLAPAVGVAALGRAPVARVWPHLAGMPITDRARGVALALFLRVVGDVAKMAGYPAGVWWRRQHAPHAVWARRQW
jgi:glycosyltransferase involved in cell wall biosynthesis